MTGTDITFATAPLAERIRWAGEISKAGDLVPSGFRNQNGTPNAAKILLAAEYGVMLGISPVAALAGINVIEGKPTPSPALMSGLIRKAGHKLRVTSKGTVEGGDYEATATLIRADDPSNPFTATWSPKRAARAGLCTYTQDPKTGVWRVVAQSFKGKPLPWQNFTEDLCKRRAISEVARDGAEDVLMGAHYTAEELGVDVDVDGNPTGDTTAEVIEDAEIVPDSAEEEVRVAAVWAGKARAAATRAEALGLYRDARKQGLLAYTTADGEFLGDILLERGKNLAEQEAQAAAGEPEIEPEYDESELV